MSQIVRSERDLVSVCYDGNGIVTPWAGTRFVAYQQIEHADSHRDRVRAYLCNRKLNRLWTREEVAA